MPELKVPVSPADHVLGSSALVTLVEYGDFQCPHCARAHPIINSLREHFGDQLRFVFRHFPLTQIHPLAEPAAEAAEFAGTHRMFWEMHNAIYENQARLSESMLEEVTEGLGLPAPDLLRALESHEFRSRVRNDFMGGVRSGVNGTPTLFINGIRHDKSYEYDDLLEAIDDALSPRIRAA